MVSFYSCPPLLSILYTAVFFFKHRSDLVIFLLQTLHYLPTMFKVKGKPFLLLTKPMCTGSRSISYHSPLSYPHWSSFCYCFYIKCLALVFKWLFPIWVSQRPPPFVTSPHVDSTWDASLFLT